MPRIEWDSQGEKFFETGLDRGVLYIPGEPGVSWNGLIDVSHGDTGSDSESYYYDGIKYLNFVGPSEFQANIEAFTYPDQFLKCEGIDTDQYGIGYDEQVKSYFGLTYRTGVGNDVDGVDHGYKIHLVYNALAKPASKNYGTRDDSPAPSTFTWDVITTPLEVPNRRPTSHLILDSRKLTKGRLELLEFILYGSTNTLPSLPTPEVLISAFSGREFRINLDPETGLSPISPDGQDIIGSSFYGIYSLPPGTRLVKTDNGMFRLEQNG